MRHIIHAKDISREDMEMLFKSADALEGSREPILEGKILASLFFEPSTRTRFSFESAMYRLGGNVITAENAKEFSSTSKGETIEDTIKVIGAYADVVVMRHFQEGAAAAAAKVSTVPVINAGDGIGQHPTQTLLDLYLIQREFGKIDGISIVIIGDLKNGRTIKSLLWGLSKFKDIKITLVSPKALRLTRECLAELQDVGITVTETEDLESVIGDADIVYQTRIQKERFPTIEEYEKYKGCYLIDVPLAKKMKPKALLLHPLPRVDEIAPEVDDLPQAAYFKQAKYGVLMRKAVLKWILVD